MKGILSIAKNGNWYTDTSYVCLGCPECCQCGNENCACPDNCTPIPDGSLCNGCMHQCIAQLDSECSCLGEECPKNRDVIGCECFMFGDPIYDKCSGHIVKLKHSLRILWQYVEKEYDSWYKFVKYAWIDDAPIHVLAQNLNVLYTMAGMAWITYST